MITEYAFGDSVGALDRPDMGKPWNTMMITGVQETQHFARHFPGLVIGLLTLAKYVPVGDSIKEVHKFTQFIKEKTRRAFDRAIARKTNQDKTAVADRTVLDEMVLGETMPSEEKELKRLEAEAMIMIGAGTETTARTLTITLYHILANQEIYSRLLQELRTVMKHPESSLPPVSRRVYPSSLP